MIKTQENTELNKFQPQGRVKTIKGTILAPENAGLRLVLSVANMGGTTDNPLYKMFDKKWKKVREETKGWFTTRTGSYKLGANNTTAVQSDTWVIQMLCQDKELTTDVKSLEECLKKVCQMAKYEKATVHVSSILLDQIPEMKDCLNKQLILQGVNVYFYEEKA